jgi:hypothetical protein
MTIRFTTHRLVGAAAFATVGAADEHARRHVQLRSRLTASPTGQAARTAEVDAAQLALYGPGDVVGIDPNQVVRRTPRPGDHQAEPNYLAAIEFAHPALPWLFSPEGAVAQVRPWMMLVVVSQDDPKVQVEHRIGSPNPVLVVDDPALLPPPGETWAWAHAQERDGDERSRLVCPTGLQPNRRYLACVVPVYEAGRRAGLGNSPGGGAQTWATVGKLELPIYDQWSFRTGPSGDFETLARKLGPIKSYEGIGSRKVVVDEVAAGLRPVAEAAQAFPPDVREVPTAISKGPTPPHRSLAPGGGADYAPALQRRLKQLLDITASAAAEISADIDEDPIVGPPLYGQWHAAVSSLDGHPDAADLQLPPPGGPQRWVEELNANPDQRLAAGAATRVVRRDQEELMATAWTQLEQVLAANRRIRWSQLFEVAAQRIHRQVAALPAARALRLTAPVLARTLVAEATTTAAMLDASTMPRAIVQAPFARAARFLARSTPGRDVTLGAVVNIAAARLSASDAQFVPALTRPLGDDFARLRQILTDERLVPGIEERLQVSPADAINRIETTPQVIADLAPTIPTITRLTQQPARPDEASVGVQVASGSVAETRLREAVRFTRTAIQEGRLAIDEETRAELFGPASEGALSMRTLQQVNTFVADTEHAPEGLRLDSTGVTVRFAPSVARNVQAFGRAAGDDRLAAIFTRVTNLRDATVATLGFDIAGTADILADVGGDDRAAVRDNSARLVATIRPSGAPIERPAVARADLEAVATRVVEEVRPEVKYSQMLAFAHRLGDHLVADELVRQRSPLHPIMAAPTFADPLVERLRRFDQEWVLGGASKLPSNSIAILEVNRAFVEACIAGANHEAARELLWRGYPTDLRGSYFRRFWPTVAWDGALPPDDVLPLHRWQEALGKNGSPAYDSELTMVVVKGDLLRRYPATIITAERGRTTVADGNTDFINDPPTPGESVLAREVFRGWLDPDIAYVALDIPIGTLLWHDDPDIRHCWYISFRQPLEEPRLGLDDNAAAQPGSNVEGNVADWSWQGVINGDPRSTSDPHLHPAQLRNAPPGAVPHSAQVARNLYQPPFRLLLRAFEYLPEVPQ